ncbi:hypothetical protein SFC79_05980 [Nocardioides sp. S-58]|uniref:WD40 repeat protein n=1 Tax=Nocardioides renjunii TaxID=3095075 RepID=A0ABU5K9P8_9ACTN|nr:hypothetical protein [Nocardioides sp. S-58]MDZ5661310.1 hypothetical protein [Nocardioides sp. S-58]
MRLRRARLASAVAVLLVLAGCSSSQDGRDEGRAGGDGGQGAEQGDLVEVPGVLLDGDAAALSPDGARLAVPCDARLCVWSTADGSLQEQWDGGAVVAWGAADRVATDRVEDGSVDVVVLDPTTGREVAAAEAHRAEDVQDGTGGGLRDLAFAPDGSTLAGVGGDGVVRLWPADLADVVEVTGTGDGVAVAFSPDGERVAVASSDAAVSVHDAATGEPVGSLAGPAQGDVAWSDDGASIATASFALDDAAATTVWDADSYDEVATLPRAGHHLAFTPGSDALVLSVKDQLDVVRWDWAGDDVRTFAGATDPPRAVVASADRVLAVSPRDGVLAWDVDGGEPTVFEPVE